jgi:hypothetical protein
VREKELRRQTRLAARLVREKEREEKAIEGPQGSWLARLQNDLK